MRSDKDWLMEIGNGLDINADKNEKSYGYADKRYFDYP